MITPVTCVVVGILNLVIGILASNAFSAANYLAAVICFGVAWLTFVKNRRKQ